MSGGSSERRREQETDRGAAEVGERVFAITRALASHLELLGGEVRTDHPVRSRGDLPSARVVLFDTHPGPPQLMCTERGCLLAFGGGSGRPPYVRCQLFCGMPDLGRGGRMGAWR